MGRACRANMGERECVWITYKNSKNIINTFDFRKRGPLSLVSTTEELLDRKVAAPV
jgi:hypothetical protein